MNLIENGRHLRVAAALGVSIVLLTTSMVPFAQAATGNQGYAVYRDGVAVIEWHAAIMDDPHYNTTSSPVIHHPGDGWVRFGSWAKLLDGQNYKGVFRPKATANSAARDNFNTMARKLATEQIPYSLLFQVDYNSFSVGSWVEPSEISAMRCDGVVEYVYEWYGFRVYGNDGQWDVTRADPVIKALHSGMAVTPKIQANSHLTKVSSSLP